MSVTITALTRRMTRQQLQALVFLVVLPAVNWLVVTPILYDMGVATLTSVGLVALRFWLVFGSSFAVLVLVRHFLPALLHPDFFWRQLFVHLLVIVGVSTTTAPLFETPEVLMPIFGRMVFPRIFLTMEIMVYVAVMWMLRQQELRFESADRLREAQLSVLKFQSNPHFLFNTLNLIAAEISDDPSNAKDIVFDLADLLRSNIQLAKQRRVSVKDEMHMASLYLGLQQRRFHDRLTYSMHIDDKTAQIEIPALLLQPVVENTVKWAVAPYAQKAHVNITTKIHGDRWWIVIRDSGPSFDEAGIVEGDGFRILRRTLDLEYPGNYQLRLRSTERGGLFSLQLPMPTSRH